MVIFAAVVAVISVIAGPLLWLQARGTAEEKDDLICSLGELISSAPVTKRPDQTQAEYRRNLANLRKFASELDRIADCPIKIEILTPEKAQAKGGGNGGGGPPGPPGPPGGGHHGPPPSPPKPGPPSVRFCIEHPRAAVCIGIRLGEDTPLNG
jgi:hypothetical protein